MGRGGRPSHSLRETLPAGADLWIVGGAVRDMLSGARTGDTDLALGGLSPEDAEQWLGSQGKIETLQVAGKTIGWRVRSEGEEVEVALLRREESTGPGHGDFRTETDSVTIDEDLSRRDFTCNAIALDAATGELRDPWGGAGDIESRTLRALGEHVFREDPLRLLRGAVRVGRDGFWPDEETLEWMRSADTTHLSPERVWGEMQKIVGSPGAGRALRMLREAGQYGRIMPELAPTLGWDQRSRYHSLPCDEHCIRALEEAEGESERVLWAALLHDAGKPASAWLGEEGNLHYYANEEKGKRDHAEEGADIALALLHRLRAPRQLQEDVAYLVRHHMWQDVRGWENRTDEKQGLLARRFIARHGDLWPDLVALRRADASSKGRDASEEMRVLDLFEERVRREAEGDWQKLDISGHDLVALGLQGEAVGRVLGEIKSRIVDRPDLNERERLLEWARRLARKEGVSTSSRELV